MYVRLYKLKCTYFRNQAIICLNTDFMLDKSCKTVLFNDQIITKTHFVQTQYKIVLCLYK